LIVDLLADNLPALRDRARDVMRRAYAPYSKFRVGAALLAEDGSVHVGCNVENASYPAGTCAERAALASAVSNGKQRFAAVVIASEAPAPTPPCGICRQALAEFGLGLTVVSVAASGAEARWPLSALLPHAFTPSSLHNR
jgi:cytidine deaminase